MNNKRNDIIGGILLVLFGLLALIGQFVNFGELVGLLIVPGIGFIFLIAGIVARQPGFLIPGGILSGIGAGILLIEGPFAHVNGDAEGGIFLLAFAAGWVLITVTTAVFSKQTHWWPLIPGSILALIGGGLLTGGIMHNMLEIVGKIWPIFLILGGIYVLYRGSQQNKEKFQ